MTTMEDIERFPFQIEIENEKTISVIVEGRKPNCYLCGSRGHIKKECPLYEFTAEQKETQSGENKREKENEHEGKNSENKEKEITEKQQEKGSNSALKENENKGKKIVEKEQNSQGAEVAAKEPRQKQEKEKESTLKEREKNRKRTREGTEPRERKRWPSQERHTANSYSIWRTRNQDSRPYLDEKKLANVRRDILRNNRLTDSEISAIKHATENDINIRHKGNEELDEQYSPPRGLIERLPSDQSTQRPEDTRNYIVPVKDNQENDKTTVTEELAFAEEHRTSMAEMRHLQVN
ncbi:---NA--- [Octopus vulgaris]|uniref:---NA n=1 Tax=Octopus vulgaris TaxID=6645 RepID=A0AA36B350_OCTVU|nr:---NA--- [Octopus vulgaris]